MINDTITCKFLRDRLHVEAIIKADLRRGHIYILDIPRLDLTKWSDACVVITISDNENLEGL